ncbi:MAG: Hsp20/alpha crystallin family protein [Chloroflexi bacterium]|nr:Hsp20/alpha crystallin family protein [Chloroflexota bacterium]
MAELKRYEPHTYATVQDVFDRLFDRSLFGPGLFSNGATTPVNRGFPANLWETDEAYVLELAIPGVNPDDIEMTLSKGSLIIKGRYERPETETGTSIWRNLPEGEFEIAYTLPSAVYADEAAVSWSNGIFKVHLPKEEKAKSKRLKIRVGE